MATAKAKAATTAPQPPAFATDYIAETAQFQNAQKIILDKDGKIREGKIESAINVLALARDGMRRLDLAKKESLKPAVKLSLPITTISKKLDADYEGVAKALAAALMDLLQESGELPDETKQGIRLSIITKPGIEIEDATLVPDDYVLPRAIDKAKVMETLAPELAVNKALVEAGEDPRPLSIPGVKIVNSIIFQTRIPENVAA